MRKRTVIALVAIAFITGIFFSNLIPLSHAVETAPVDRTPYVLYPKEEYKTDRNVVLYLEDKYFHAIARCPFTHNDPNSSVLVVSRYEAVERGFLPCPNCIFEEVKIQKN